MSPKVFTHCRYCVSLCGVTVTVSDDGRVVESIEPDRENTYAWRDFCRKGRTAAERVEHPRRITQPMRRVGERWETATYEEAISDIASRLTRIIERDGADAVGSYAGNPLAFNFGGTTFFNALLDAIGSGNRYYVTSVDTNANHVVTEAMYGSEFFPLTCDIDEAHCFLLIGMDPAVSKWGWIDSAPAAWKRITERERRGDADVIVVDPRRSATAEQATTHVAICPGGDWAFLLGLLKVIFEEGRDRRPHAVDLGGVDVVRGLAASAELADLSARCGVTVDTIQDVARRFAGAPTAFCNTHTGVSHTGTAGGTVAEWLGQVLNAVTNRLDVPGGRRFERGYVDVVRMWAMLAPKTKHRSRLRDLPAITGYHALGELPDEIRIPGPDQIRAMLITAGNPVISGPDGDALDEALGTLELLVAVDLVQRESHRHADWLIPAEHWLERDELTLVTGSLQEYPYVQYGSRAIDRPASVMPEWKFYADLALAMKRPLFGVRGVNTAIKVSRWLSARLDRPSLELTPHTVEALMVATGRRVKLRDIKARPHGWRYADKRYGDMRRALRTPDKRVNCAPAAFVCACRELLRSPVEPPRSDMPLSLINRRHRESMNSWLNESPGLFVRSRTNHIELHPDDALAAGVEDGAPARVVSDTGSITAPVKIVDDLQPGVAAMAHGWGSRVFDPVGGAEPLMFGANRNLLVGNREFDPLSQVVALGGTRVRVEPLPPDHETLATDELPGAVGETIPSQADRVARTEA